MTTYKLVDGKWGDWVKAWETSRGMAFNSPYEDIEKGVWVYYGDNEREVDFTGDGFADHIVLEPIVEKVDLHQDTFESDREPVGACCPNILCHTLTFTLTPDEFRALATLKFRVPKTNVQDDIFSALAKLKEALGRAESELAEKREVYTCTGLDPHIREGWADDCRMMADGTSHPLDAIPGEEKTLRKCIITDEYGAELVIANVELVCKILDVIHSYIYNEETDQ